MADTQKGQYTYDPKSNRFRGPDGRYIAHATVMSLRDEIIAAKVARTTSLVNMLYDGTITPTTFVLSMRDQIKRATLMEYMLGRGGVNAMTPADYGRVGAIIKPQYRYLDTFTRQIIAGEVTRDQAIYRASLYMDSARKAQARGNSAAWDVHLPAYPGLHPNCLCEVEVKGVGDAVHAYWHTRGANPCAECEGLESEWRPLVIERNKGE